MTPDAAPSRPLAPPRHVKVVAAVSLVLLGVAAAAFSLLHLTPVPRDPHLRLSPALLVVLFAASQATVLNVQIRREARSIYLSEVPFALALAFCSASGVVVSRTLGGVLTCLVLRRQYRQPLKLTFNTVVAFVEAATGLAVYRVVADGAPAYSVHGWVALILANVVASTLAALGVAVVIQLIENDVALRDLAGVLPSTGLQAGVISVIGIIGVIALNATTAAAVPLILATAALLTAYRAYSSLRERHLTLERLYRFTQVVSSIPEMSEVLIGVLSQARELLHADRAVVAFLAGGDEDTGAEVSLTSSGRLHRGAATVLTPDPASPLVPAFGGDAPVLIERGTREPRARQWMDRHQLRDLVAVPLMGDAGVIGVLAVTDRLGEARGFDREDVRLLETVANHASIALLNGRLVDQLRYESLHDALTGLPNRVHFQREIDRRLADEQRGLQVAVGILDLDSFKEINDTLGHARGDELLQEIAARLSTACADDAMVARLGGDEFAVAFACEDVAAAKRFGEYLVSSLHQPVVLGDSEVDVGGSLGLAITSISGANRTTLLKHADIAMYAAKNGAYDVTVYDAGLDRTAPSRLTLVGQLRQAITADELTIVVQPQVALLDGRLLGVEALVRWEDLHRGSIPPQEFIPLAERSGLIRPMTELVLRKSLAACAGWQAELPGVGVSVNISLKSLTDDDLIRQVDHLLHRYAVPPSLLCLEITESSIMSDPAKGMSLLHALRARGVKLSIDDFGTGYSSLSYLRRLPVTAVKIDQSFVAGLDTDTDDAAIARSIIDLGRSLGLEVIAEGVETLEAWQTLRHYGCTGAQGFYMARPLPPDDLLDWHRAWSPPPAVLQTA